VSEAFLLAATPEAVLAPRLEQRILPGLDRMHGALAALGHPERGLTSVLVLGTNGKGSTAALLASMLRAHGVRVGLYTSPHLVAVEERIRVDGEPIASHSLLARLHDLRSLPDLSYFETLTCAAILHFAEVRVGIAVMEAGLGGRWDASNAVDPLVALLTNVGTDHARWLGEGRRAIAREKAAALRGCEAIVGAWDDEVESTIRAGADPATPLSLAAQWASVTGNSVHRTGHGERTSDVADAVAASPTPFAQEVAFAVAAVRGTAVLPLAGPHQLANLQLALAAMAALAKHGVLTRVSAPALVQGIQEVAWPGRLQPIEVGGRRLLLDGAHNREATAALVQALDELSVSGQVHLLFSCFDDKPIADMAALLRPRVTGVTIVELESPRATPLARIAQHFPGSVGRLGIGEALAALPSDRLTLVTGSLRLVGAVLAHLEGRDG
jgi:dihydrofolate synthase / folylpolyglutamate synthase